MHSSCSKISTVALLVLNFQNAPLMRCRPCHFPRRSEKTHLLNFFAVLVFSYWLTV
jgi:hypothetical protein